MSNYTRTNGANARAQRWDDLFEEQAASTGSWLPLDALDHELTGGQKMRPVPASGSRLTTAHPAQQSRLGPAPHKGLAHGMPGAGTTSRHAGSGSLAGLPARAVAMLAGAALCAAAAYVIVSAAVQWTQVKLDDLQYGRPRTTQLDAFVGHSEAEGVPTHFIALNLNRRVTIIEMPGGDAAKATTLIGPYLFGEGEDLTPVQAAVEDVNIDGAADLIVSVKNEQLLYLNDGQGFKLITPEEKAALQKSLATQSAEAQSGEGAAGEAGK